MTTQATSTISPQNAAEVFVPSKKAQTREEAIGERLSRFRRERGITQIELAEMLGIAQPMISGYERGQLRLHGELIVELTRILGVTADELLGLEESGMQSPVKNKRLLRKLRELDSLPRRDQDALLRTIDAFLRKAG